MKVNSIKLTNFRNHSKAEFGFDENISIIVGKNGSGKTNILEAIYLLSTGISERAGVTEEMIRFGEDIATVSGVVEHEDERTELSVVLTNGVYMGKHTPKRRYLVDGVARTRANIVGKLASVLFRPEDMMIVEGSPSRRRDYINDTLCMAHPEYARALSVYEASLKRRNRLLDAIREGLARKEQLSYWDQSIIKNGNILTDYRRDFLSYLSQLHTSFGEYELEYDASTISPSRLLQYESAEVAVGYTLVGPHKDDFAIKSNGRDLMKYGSRGEQRLAVLFLKLGNMQYVEAKLGIRPILLLDDIFSELDRSNQKLIFNLIGNYQTVVTSTDEEIMQLINLTDYSPYNTIDL